jgi:hypothetical protein
MSRIAFTLTLFENLKLLLITFKGYKTQAALNNLSFALALSTRQYISRISMQNSTEKTTFDRELFESYFLLTRT